VIVVLAHTVSSGSGRPKGPAAARLVLASINLARSSYRRKRPREFQETLGSCEHGAAW
jgi:hypothetical protein